MPDANPYPRPVARRFDTIICDIDGCLGPESVAPLDAPALARIAIHNQEAERREDRPVLTLCSGRPQPFVECLCRLLSNTTVPCVCENGVWLFDPRDQAYLLDPLILPEHLAGLERGRAWVHRELSPSGVIIQPGKTASMSLWHKDTAYLKSLIPRIEAAARDEAWGLRISSTIAWINCDLDHVSKGTGIARLMQAAGLQRQRLAGVGDTLGDLAIRERVEWFACPANAVPELRQVADFVSAHAEVEGVLDILERVPR